MIRLKQNFWSIIIISIALILLTRPFFHDGFFQMMDDIQVVRIEEMAKELKNGQFPVRLVSDFGNGGGYMLFNYTPPLPYYLGALYHLAGLPLVKATKLTFLTAFFFGTLGMYFLLKKFTDKTSTTIGVLLFLTSAYLNYDVYLRGALMEFFALMFIPWLILAYSNKNILFSALITALIVLSHPMIALISLGLLIFLTDKIKSYLISVFLGLSLSAFFWLPSVVEMKYVIYSQSFYGQKSYLDYFFNLWQIVGINHPTGTLPPPILGIGLFFGVIVCLMVFIRSRRKSGSLNGIFRFSIISFTISVFLMLPVSKTLWDNISYLRYFQFPFRFLTFATVASVLIISLGISKLKKVWIKILFGFLIILPVFLWQRQYLQPVKYLSISEYKAEDICRTTTWEQEFLPVWTKKCLPINNVLPFIIEKDEGVYVSDLKISKGGRKISFKTSGQGGGLTVKRYYFPGWTARVDNKIVKTTPSGQYGLINLNVPSGSRQVEIGFEDSLIRKSANIISLATFLVIVIVLATRR